MKFQIIKNYLAIGLLLNLLACKTEAMTEDITRAATEAEQIEREAAQTTAPRPKRAHPPSQQEIDQSLQAAVIADFPADIKSLLARGANPNQVIGGKTLLNIVTEETLKGRRSYDPLIVQELLAHGAKPTTTDLLNTLFDSSKNADTVFEMLLIRKPDLVDDATLASMMKPVQEITDMLRTREGFNFNNLSTESKQIVSTYPFKSYKVTPGVLNQFEDKLAIYNLIKKDRATTARSRSSVRKLLQ